MKIAIMQPYFMPYVGYIKLVKEADVFVFLDDVGFIKRGFINRNFIAFNNERKRFTLPVKNMSINRAINEHEYVGDFDMFKKIIYQSYKKCPFYNEHVGKIDSLLDGALLNVSCLNIKALKWVANVLDIKTEFLLASQLSLDPHLKGADRIVRICHALGSEVYLNLPNGRSLYSESHFKSFGLDIFFVSPSEVNYKQYNNDNDFLPFLSVLDVMFNSDPDFITKKVLA